MYRQIGATLTLGEKEQELLDAHIVQIALHCRNQYPDFDIEDNKRRTTFRVKIERDFPDNLKTEAWIYNEDEFRKCIVKDISSRGIRVTLTFPDENDSFIVGSAFKAILLINEDRIKCGGKVAMIRSFKPTAAVHNLFDDLKAEKLDL